MNEQRFRRIKLGFKLWCVAVVVLSAALGILLYYASYHVGCRSTTCAAATAITSSLTLMPILFAEGFVLAMWRWRKRHGFKLKDGLGDFVGIQAILIGTFAAMFFLTICAHRPH